MPSRPHRATWRSRLSTAFAARTRTYRSRSLGWRLLAPAVFVLAGGLFVASMVTSQGTDLRAGRYDDLNGLANAEARDLEGLRAHAADLTAQVDRLSKDRGSTAARSAEHKVGAPAGPGGGAPGRGPGGRITLVCA